MFSACVCGVYVAGSAPLPAGCNEAQPVSQTHDTFQMYAESEKEMDSWIDAIVRVLYEVS